MPAITVRAHLRPDAFSTEGAEAVDLRLAPGATLADAIAEAVAGAAPPEECRHFILAEIDGRPVPAELWEATPAPAADTGRALALTALPRGRILRPILQIALLVAAIVLPPALGFAAGTVGAALAGAAIATVGSLAINALFPLPTPALPSPAGGGQAAPERLVASAAANRLRPYGRRTLVLGRMRFAPDLMAQQVLSPGGSRDTTVTLPSTGQIGLIPNLDRVAWLDLGLGDLAVYDDDGAVWMPGAATADAGEIVIAGSAPMKPVWAAGPGKLLAALAGNRPSDFWPLRARAVDHNTRPLSGARVDIDATRRATRLIVVAGGLLYDSAANGDLENRDASVRVYSPPVGEFGALAYNATLRNNTLSPEYAALEVAGGERDWWVSSSSKSTTARARTELSIVGSYWLESAAAVAGLKVPSTAAAVRLKGTTGAPANAVLRIEAAQRVPTPDAAGVWSGATASRSPAALLRAFARGWYDEGGVLLAGTGRPAGAIDDAVLARWHSWCENHDPPLRCDLVLQGDTRPAEEIERLIAACGRAEVSWATGKFGVVWPDPSDAPQGLISPANVLPGSLSMAWRDGRRPDAVVASYHDRAVWDARETARIPVPGGQAPPVRERAIRLEGVTEAEQATFLAACAAAEEGHRRRAISWRSGRQGTLMTRGSVWLMAADLISGGVTGRLREAAPDRVRLDRPVRVAGSIWLAVDAPGLGLHQTLAVPPGDHPPGGETDRLTLADPLPGLGSGSGARDVLWRAYDPNRPPRKVRIAANRPLSKTEHEIAAFDETDDYWRFLDDYREAPQVPAPIILPGVVRPGAGAWQVPQAWLDMGIRKIVIVYSAGGGGAAGFGDGWPPYPKGQDGADTTVTGCPTARGGGGGGRSRHDLDNEDGGRGGRYWVDSSNHLNGQPGERRSCTRSFGAAGLVLNISIGAGGDWGDRPETGSGRADGGNGDLTITPVAPASL